MHTWTAHRHARTCNMHTWTAHRHARTCNTHRHTRTCKPFAFVTAMHLNAYDVSTAHTHARTCKTSRICIYIHTNVQINIGVQLTANLQTSSQRPCNGHQRPHRPTATCTICIPTGACTSCRHLFLSQRSMLDSGSLLSFVRRAGRCVHRVRVHGSLDLPSRKYTGVDKA